MSRSKGLLALAVAVVLASAACTGSGGSTPSNRPGGPKILRSALNEDVGSIDPDNNFEVSGLGIILAMYQGLVRYKPDSNQLEGLLAKSWEVSPDASIYTFHLQSGVYFHDGTPMTSQSIADSFQRRIDHQDLFTGYFLAGVKSMQTDDPQTLVVNLSGPDYSFLDGLASPWGPKVIGPDALKTNAGDDYSKTWLNLHADGTGPYQLDTFARGSQYVIKRFSKYWGTKPYFDEVQLKIVPDVSQQILQLRSGQLDFVQGYPFSQLGSVASGLKILSWNTFGMELAIINTHRIADKAVRLKIAAAINPTQWLSQAFTTYATPAESNFATEMVRPTTPWAWPTAAASATVPEITIGYASTDTSLQASTANFLVANLDRAGIKATARVIPTDQFNALNKNPDTAPDIALVHFYPDDAFPGSLTYLVYQCGTPLNYLAYCNEAADARFNEAWGTEDPTARNQSFLEGAKIQYDDASFLGLADIKDVIVYRDGLTSLQTYPGLPWNFDYATAREG